jgi:inorganic triphosphatase YgiF
VREIELKLEAEPDVLARVRRSRVVAELASDDPSTQKIETTYFDSTDQRLAKKRIALRIRKHGRQFEQTAKAETKANGAAPMRIEWSAPTDGLSPRPELIGDSDIRKRVSKLMAKGELAPYCKTRVRRTLRKLKTKQGDEIELAFDAGELVVADGAETPAKAPISELELELKSGNPKSLVVLARRLAEEFPVRLAIKSKAERGLEMAAQARYRPRKAGDVELGAETSVSEGFAAVISHCLHHALANEDAILHAQDPEGVHQMRVAMRRLRSAVSAFGKPLRTKEIARLRAEAKWLAAVLGKARNYDVFLAETLAPLRATRPDDEKLALLERLIRSEREEAWRETSATLNTARYRLLMIDLGCAVACEAWRTDETDPEAAAILASTLASHARRILTKRLAKASDLGKRIEELETSERHQLRIQLKKLRYAGEFFESLFPAKAATAYLKKVAELQQVFGYLNDAVTADEIISEVLSRHHEQEDQLALAWAAGIVTGWHSVRVSEAWAHAQERWKALEKSEPFWLEDA